MRDQPVRENFNL